MSDIVDPDQALSSEFALSACLTSVLIFRLIIWHEMKPFIGVKHGFLC